MLKSVCLLLFNIAFLSKQNLEFNFFFIFFVLQMLPNKKIYEKNKKVDGALKQSCHELFLYLSFLVSPPSPEHEIPFQFIEFSSTFLSFSFFSYSKLIFCSLRNLIYIEIVYFSPFSVLSVPVLLNVADKIRFVSF